MLLIPAGESERREGECELEEPADAGGFVLRASSDAKKPDAGRHQHLVHEAVSPSPIGDVVRSVIELDGEHDGRCASVAENEVEVLLRDSSAVSAEPIVR